MNTQEEVNTEAGMSTQGGTNAQGETSAQEKNGVQEEINQQNESEKPVNEVEVKKPAESEEQPKEGFKQKLQLWLGWLFLYGSSYVMIFVGQLLGVILLIIAEGALIASGQQSLAESDVMITAENYVIFIGMWIVVLPCLALRKVSRPIFKSLWTSLPGNTWKGFLIGAAIGGGANASCILIAWLHQDIKLYFDSFRILPLLFLLVAVLVQSAAEELVCRVYLYQKLMKLYRGNFWFCALVNSLFFALLHMGNDNVTVLSLVNIFLSGVMFTLMVYYMDSVWAAFAGHMAWNYTQNIIFGLPNSGIVVPFSIFKLEASTARNSFAYNVGFGIEGTVVADVVLLLCCVGLWFWGSRYSQKAKKAA